MANTPADSRAHAAVVYHPHKSDLSALQQAARTHEATAGWAPTRWYETAEDDSGAAATRQALDEGASVVLSSGGDGTVRAVAEQLRHTGIPLAIVPQGTGNVLARNLGMPLGDIDVAVRAAFEGEDRTIDLGVIKIVRPSEDPDSPDAARETTSEHVFLALAGMGLDARLITATSSKLKKRVGWLAYVDAGVRSIVRQAPLQIHYSVDGSAPRPMKVYSVMIGNCGLLPGGVLLIPDAKVDDGVLDVIAMRPLGPFSWLSIWRKIGWENGVLRRSKAGRRIIDLVNDTRSVTYLQAGRFAVSVPSPEPIQLDGDEFGLALAASGTVDPGALVVRVLPEWVPPGAGE